MITGNNGDGGNAMQDIVKPSRVFALEPSQRHGLANAPQWGQVIYIFNGKRPSIWDTDFEQEAIDVLDANAFDPESDLVLVAGCMAGCFALVAFLTAAYGGIRALIYDMKYHKYRERFLGTAECSFENRQ